MFQTVTRIGWQTTYRGMSLSKEIVEQLKSLIGANETIDMRGTSSWSTDFSVGVRFAEKFIGKDNPRKVLLICDGQQYGTSIKHLAKYPKECEVLCSKNGRWKIRDYNKVNGLDVFKVFI